MRRISYVAVVLALVLMIPLAVPAEEREMPCRGPMAALGLDEEQMKKMETLHMEHRMEMIDLRADQQKLRLEMKMELMNGEPDRAALMRIVEKISAVREKIAKQRIEHLLAVREILNDDQWKLFIKRHHGDGECGMLGPRGDRMHGRAGRGMGRGGCRMHGRHGMHGDHGEDMDCGGGGYKKI